MSESPPVVKIEKTSYENIVVQCPWCCQENIFNRASNLHTFEPIAGRDVLCQSNKCGKPFHIIGDSVGNPHEVLIIDCYELIERKHYMNCILTLAQAYEMFFSLFLRVVLLYKPFGRYTGRDINHFNRLAGQFREKVKKYTFVPMRALFLRQVITGPCPANLTEAEATIAGLADRLSDPMDAELEELGDKKLVALLKGIKRTTINKLRNQVVHKQAYRPKWEQAEAALKEARSLLFQLTHRLELYDSINWYIRVRS